MWDIFNRLAGVRSIGFAGPNKLSFTEIAEMLRLYRQVLEIWEVEAILLMDNTWFDFIHKRTTPEPVSTRPLTPDLFDALFGK